MYNEAWAWQCKKAESCREEFGNRAKLLASSYSFAKYTVSLKSSSYQKERMLNLMFSSAVLPPQPITNLPSLTEEEKASKGKKAKTKEQKQAVKINPPIFDHA